MSTPHLDKHLAFTPTLLPQAGLRGVNLSGGQRQRLNLARCAYFGGDIVLLDNALSAVDHHTAHHIFQNCIKTSFKDKAVVLVTHQVRLPGQRVRRWDIHTVRVTRSLLQRDEVPA